MEASHSAAVAVNTVREALFELRDEKYKAFQSALIPTISPDLIIGIRMPALRRFAKELAKTDDARTWMQALPHQYYDENNLHGLLINDMKDIDTAINALDAFLPFVDNWATCDLLRPRVFKNHPRRVFEYALHCMKIPHIYTVRFGIEMLMLYCQGDEEMKSASHRAVAAYRSEEYYINMMIGWYFATALSEDYDAALPYLTGHKLSPTAHTMAVRKARESYRIPSERKEFLFSFKQ